MLFAQVDVDSKAYHAGEICGRITAIIICAAIPIVTGLKYNKPGLGLIGGVVSSGFALPFACLSGLPVAIVFAIVIVSLANLDDAPRKKKKRPRLIEDDEDRPRRRRKRRDELEDDEDSRESRRDIRASEDDRPRRRRRRFDEDDDENRADKKGWRRSFPETICAILCYPLHNRHNRNSPPFRPTFPVG